MKNLSKKNKPGRRTPWDLIKIAFEMKENGNTLDAISQIVVKDKSTVSRWLNNTKYKNWFNDLKNSSDK